MAADSTPADSTPLDKTIANKSAMPDTIATPASTLTPAERSRLQKVFEHGQQRLAKGEHDYAHDMFAACVVKDPANLVYVEAMLDNLQRKYKQNKKGGRGRGNRGGFKKAVQNEAWKEVFELGLELLKHNPWDVPTLRSLADACATLRYNEVELRYLKNALDAKPKDVDVNRHCAKSLARMGQFDQSIACWHRIEDLLPSKSEAHEMISKLTLAKTKWAQGILDEQLMLEIAGRPSHLTTASTKPPVGAGGSRAEADPAAEAPDPAGRAHPTVKADASGATSDTAGKADTEPTGDRRQALEMAIASAPTELENYLELAKLLDESGDVGDAEQVLQRALAVSGNHYKVQEMLDAVQIRRARQRLAMAQHQAQEQPGHDEAEALVHQLKESLNRLELDVFERRSRRYPEDLALQYELAVRLKRVRNYKAAAEYFLASQDVAQREALARLNRGECLQQLHKYTEALASYAEAVPHAEDQPEVLKLALYRAGMLAAGLKDTVHAAKYLKKLVSVDPHYRDAKARLDKIESSGHK